MTASNMTPNPGQVLSGIDAHEPLISSNDNFVGDPYLVGSLSTQQALLQNIKHNSSYGHGTSDARTSQEATGVVASKQSPIMQRSHNYSNAT